MSESSTTPNTVPSGVFVTNISPSADQGTVNDFFSFCGKITSLSLAATEGGDGAQESVVTFESESAAKTALLLTNAMIVDRAIKVEPLQQAQAPHPEDAQMSSDEIKQKPFNVPDDQRSKTSVVASLLAAGYTVGTDTLTKAKDYDDKHLITLSLQNGAAAVKARALAIDEQYKVSENFQAATTRLQQAVNQIDESYGISQRVSTGYNTAKGVAVATAGVVAAKAMSNETVAAGVKKVQETSAAASQKVGEQYAALSSETAKEIEKREAAKKLAVGDTDTPKEEEEEGENKDESANNNVASNSTSTNESNNDNNDDATPQ